MAAKFCSLHLSTFLFIYLSIYLTINILSLPSLYFVSTPATLHTHIYTHIHTNSLTKNYGCLVLFPLCLCVLALLSLYIVIPFPTQHTRIPTLIHTHTHELIQKHTLPASPPSPRRSQWGNMRDHPAPTSPWPPSGKSAAAGTARGWGRCLVAPDRPSLLAYLRGTCCWPADPGFEGEMEGG